MTTEVLDRFGAQAPAHAPAHDDTHDHAHHDTSGNTIFGFWLYLMSDCILFACLFAAFAVLRGEVAGGPSGKELFELNYVLVETFILLFSSITYGMAMVSLQNKQKSRVMGWLAVTFLLGAAFMVMEINEFAHLIHEGAGPNRSAFLSSFFTLVGTHGLHVASGMLWMLVLMYQLTTKGITTATTKRLMCLSLFWHFLDVVWIGVFTVVYLMGAM
ncbi:cytochrome o ubiquinol oxidase subunit III [Cupriavidus plantarum]|uniref:Cytochrome bo(3) ubiquinol oxidase subunit 3 n=1 Tax=Cupriavidus plantarum TaxID=942865 RepID=A0A316F036_9BURK|nr:cytochrome o ubiquinol oxidase subunit III [Cupriavidus plantarum]NYH98369.1 cytochrome o ubiquinol oxidase subunit 3 [Cupriavidus plantarum]PWK38001.1 cytochrome bo3 quinol oxidase subunit 3 [Cupriavidus plantarum]REF01300.1 cytochrome bo3 quinol oxidase subunit 3 [Cupriavidus plantarum]RLK45841.1 cytochrome bo3 quinol oxidase subunit 3 [Cupriavidus plantarum]CAG2127806.1 Cytochrome bo(3) ubiquinol oxidase subunit 3 [Cupriavidus plantarum]